MTSFNIVIRGYDVNEGFGEFMIAFDASNAGLATNVHYNDTCAIMNTGQNYNFYFHTAFSDLDGNYEGYTTETFANETAWFRGISPGTGIELISFGGGLEATKASITATDSYNNLE